jgi:hypothetical protein
MNQPHKKSLFFKKMCYGKSDDEEEKKKEYIEDSKSSDSSVSIDFKDEVEEIHDNCIDPETNNKQSDILGPRYLR